MATWSTACVHLFVFLMNISTNINSSALVDLMSYLTFRHLRFLSFNARPHTDRQVKNMLENENNIAYGVACMLSCLKSDRTCLIYSQLTNWSKAMPSQ